MNFFAVVTLTVLVLGVETDTNSKPNDKNTGRATTVRVSGGNVEIATTPEDAKLVRQRVEASGGIWIDCDSLKFSVSAEGKVLECDDCRFATSSLVSGTAQLAVFDFAKGTVTLSGDDITPVEIVTDAEGQKTGQLLTAKTIELTLPTVVPNQRMRPKVQLVPRSNESDFFPADDPDFDRPKSVKPPTKERSEQIDPVAAPK